MGVHVEQTQAHPSGQVHEQLVRTPSSEETLAGDRDEPGDQQNSTPTDVRKDRSNIKSEKFSNDKGKDGEGRLAKTLSRKASHWEEAKRSGKIVLHEDEVYDQLGFTFSTRKKWWILSVVFLVQSSMNFNSAIIANSFDGVQEEFGVGQYAVRCLQGLFLIGEQSSTCLHRCFSIE